MLFFSTVGDGGVRTTLTHQRHMGQRQQKPKGKMKYHLLCKKQREGTLILVKEKQRCFFKSEALPSGSTVFLPKNCILMVHKQFIWPQVMICDWFSKAPVVSCYNVVDFLPPL